MSRRQPQPSQTALVAAFEAGQVAGAATPDERIDTHISHVFLSGRQAFKLKRAVRLPFLDFSTPDRRKAACEAELAANRPTAAALYLDVLPITVSDDGYRLGGDGKVVDWVVAMRRFNQADQFDRIAQAGALTREHIERAVETVAAAHAAAAPSFVAGHAADYRHVIRELRETEELGAERQGLHAGSASLFERLDAELTRVDALIERRRRQGRVRRGHGDLHLRNICLLEGEPIPFDALEFDARLATTDVLYDLAFLLMDLRRVGLMALSNAAMNRYWDAAREAEDALALLPFFMSLRAAVRMAVAVEAGELSEARTYRELGLQLLAREPPALLAIGGLSGSGKSAVAEAIAPRLPGPAGARLLRSDVLRKRAQGLQLEEKAAEQTYTAANRAEVYADLAARAAVAIGAGASVVADATFRNGSTRDAIAAAAHGAHFQAIWLDATPGVRLARVGRRRADASDADRAIAAAQEEPSDLPSSWRRLDADRPVAAVAAAILDGQRWC